MDKHIDALLELRLGCQFDSAWSQQASEQVAALDAAIALMRGQSWQPISTAPNDRIHVRGLWVRMRRDACPDEMEWRQYVGYIEDETGRFVDPEYGEDFGWEADDYDCWMELPAPPKQKDTADEQ